MFAKITNSKNLLRFLPVLLTLLSFPGGSHCKLGSYVTEISTECYYTNGTEQVRFFDRYIYNKKEYLYFDSKVGLFAGTTELGRQYAERLNKDKGILDNARAAVDRFCKPNYFAVEKFVLERKVKPTAKVTPTKVMGMHPGMIVCHVTGFYPSKIKVKWLRNGEEVTSDVTSTELLQNGDWTYQVHVFLELTPKSGDTYTCRVEHNSLYGPLEIRWEPGMSELERSKVLTGIGGLVLGVIFVVVGLIVYLRNKKGAPTIPVTQSQGLMHHEYPS
ncbi:DLA class II histocompatibility antigen, DR-1 beta chain-like [Latimeria chalumnae]|uniref:DLA class II histocompatibility antigen, DR-1 beta chain-like n=1 Tax=Latimeria chalumnae TaxID=7897 RepID=UPI0003C13738